MRVRHTVAALAVTGLLGTWGAGEASAAAPSNDTLAGATTISALPFDDQVDTSQGTTDALDADLNAQCGAPVTNGSVWYTYTAPEGVQGLVVDVSGSDFSAGALIAEPDGNGGYVVDACGPGATGTYVTPGTTYTILAFSDTPGVTGGTLRLHAEEAVVPTVSLSVDPRGKVDRYGNALISGTYTCTDGDVIDVWTSLTQAVGRFSIQGEGYAGGSQTCDGTQHAWSAVVVPYNGKFAGGKAASFTWGFTCGSVFCADSYVEQTIRLSK